MTRNAIISTFQSVNNDRPNFFNCINIRGVDLLSKILTHVDFHITHIAETLRISHKGKNLPLHFCPKKGCNSIADIYLAES
jgi:hypothetical protein